MSHAWLRSTFALLLSLGLAAPVFAADGDGKGKGPGDGQAGAAKGPRDGQGPAGKGPRDGQGFPSREEMLKRFDKNGDGQLDDNEKNAARAEFAARGGKPGEGGGMSPERKAELMKRFDKNNDGKLDDAERAAARAEFEKMRGAKGGDGKPGAGKPGEGRGLPSREEMLKRFDKNGDGQLDDAEKAAAKAEFGNRGPGGDKPGPKPNGDQPGGKKPEKN